MKKLIITGVIVAVVAVGAFFATTALAAGNQDTAGTSPNRVNNDTSWTCPYWDDDEGTSGSYLSPELQRIAGFLGLTPEELRTQLQDGKTLAQIAESQNITRQALLDEMIGPAKDKLELDVKYGYLTQTQADAYLQQHTENAGAFVDRVFTDTAVNGEGYGPGCGYGTGWGGMMDRDNDGGWGMMGGYNGGNWEMGPGMMNGYGYEQNTNPGPASGGYNGGWGGMMGGFGGGMMR